MNATAWQQRILVVLAGLAALALLLVLWASFADKASESANVETAVLEVAATPAPTTTAAPTTTTAAPTTTTTTTLPPRVATMAFTGDTLAHRGVVRQAQTYAGRADAPPGAEYDFAPMFALVQPYLATADLAICHLETPLSPDNRNLSGYPTFNVPHEMASSLAAVGYDGCTFASNHSLDRRPEGVVDTLNVLDDAELKHSGSARDAAEFATPTIYDANGIAVASLSYSYGFNGFTEPSDMPWIVNEINIAEITAEVAAARAAGAEYVVLSVHWGTEYRYDPDEFQLATAKELAAIDGIDIVIGHHAHVVQPVALVDGVPVVYGLGNFLSNQSSNCCAAGSQDGMIMLVHIDEHREEGDEVSFETSLTYVPTRVDRSDFTIVPVMDALTKADHGTLSEAELIASRERTAEVVGRIGSIEVGESGPFGSIGSIGEVSR